MVAMVSTTDERRTHIDSQVSSLKDHVTRRSHFLGGWWWTTIGYGEWISMLGELDAAAQKARWKKYYAKDRRPQA